MAEQSQFFNPFDFTKVMGDFDPSKVMNQFTKAFGEYQMPSVDVNSMMEGQRKNVEALIAANKVALEGIQALMTRQSEMLQQSMDQASVALKDVQAADTPQAAVDKQGELIKEAFEKALANMRELAEMSAKLNTDAMDKINKRFAEFLEELKQAPSKAAAAS